MAVGPLPLLPRGERPGGTFALVQLGEVARMAALLPQWRERMTSAADRQGSCLTRQRGFRTICPVADAAPSPEEAGASEAETIGRRLRRLRRERGLSQRELAGPGVSYAYISRIEAGARYPSIKAIRLLARKLGVSADHLETGRGVSPYVERAVRLSDAELAMRLEADTSGAAATFRAVLAEAEEDGDVFSRLRAQVGLGLLLARRGDYQEAVRHLGAARRSGAFSPLSRPDVYAELGRGYAALGSPHQAVSLFEECLSALTADAPGEQGLRLRFASYLSSALADAGRLKEARDVLLEVDSEDAAPIDRIRILWAAARVSSMAGDAAAALSAMQTAISLAEVSENTVDVARAHLHCSQILVLDGQHERARPHLERAERLLDREPDASDTGVLRTQQAFVAAAAGAADEALERAREAIDLLKEESALQGSAWYALGQALTLRREYDAAHEAYGTAINHLNGTGEWREAASVYRAWSNMLRAAGRDAEAFDVMEQATLLAVRYMRSGVVEAQR